MIWLEVSAFQQTHITGWDTLCRLTKHIGASDRVKPDIQNGQVPRRANFSRVCRYWSKPILSALRSLRALWNTILQWLRCLRLCINRTPLKLLWRCTRKPCISRTPQLSASSEINQQPRMVWKLLKISEFVFSEDTKHEFGKIYYYNWFYCAPSHVIVYHFIEEKCIDVD